MTTTTSERRGAAPSTGSARPTRGGAALYSSLIGLAALAVLLQGLWAGLFVREGQAYEQSWVEVHARGADLSIALAALATAAALWKLRSAKELWIGSGALAVLLIVNSYLGGLISEGHSGVTAIHVPLAMALMGLATWLPFRAARATRAAA